MNEQYDDELRRRLEQYSEDPDDRLWDSITARIEEENRASRLRKKTRNGWIFLFGVVMICGFYTLVDSIHDENSSYAQAEAEQKSTEQIPQDYEGTSKISLPLLPPADAKLKPVTSSALKTLTEGVNSRTSQGNLRQALPFHDSTGIPKYSRIVPIDRRRDGETQDIALSMESTKPSLGKTNSDDRSAIYKEGKSTFKNYSIAVVKETVAKETTNKKAASQPDNQHKEKKKLPFNIYFTIMPTLGYQRIEPNSNDNLIIESIDRIATFSPDRLGVRAELGVEYPITSRINVFGGFVYFQRHQTIGYIERQVIETDISKGPNGDLKLDPEYTYVQKSFDYEVRNLGWQIGANYQLSKRKFLHTVGTGIEFHVALNKLHHSEQNSEFTNNPSVYIFYNLYYRLQYPADTKLRAVMQPTLNYSFYIDQNANAPFYVKPYGLGLNIGFTYNF